MCFASGFREAQAEDSHAADLQDSLLDAAGDMPILGPNCYGFVNYLDGALLWPDQHGGQSTDRGVAVVTQSSNIAINLTMQKRALPLAYVVTAGNQAQVGLAEIGMALLEDERVTALGLHIEGVGDLRQFEALSETARKLGKPIVALKVGRSHQARAATVSHTASLAGEDSGAEALLNRLEIGRVDSLPVFLETLKLLHVVGRLPDPEIATISCSGGEASLAADLAIAHEITFPPLNALQAEGLRDALGPLVALANPLDYHTYIWRNVEAMTRCFAAMMAGTQSLTLLIVDFPRDDRCDPGDWDCVIASSIAAKAQTGARVGMVASLPELMPESVAEQLIVAGIVPLCGLDEALAAIRIAARPSAEPPPPLLLPTASVAPDLMPEAEAKRQLALHGLPVPKARRAKGKVALTAALREIGTPAVVKAEGLAHKSEVGGVFMARKGTGEAISAALSMPCDSWLIEEMIEGGVAELLIGVVKDPAHGFVMTLAAGGVLTEVLKDSASFLLPATDAMIDNALDKLRIAPLLRGYRGAPAGQRAAILRAVRAVEDYVVAHADGLEEIEINPLICTPDRAIAVDALIRRKE
ncbi:Acyl-CoA synthetase (NDP forming) [Salinihabitans flavidus]|uniref:Acyl-CoA synthetase (NDP forming) n=1 Tax=Salinihabitans flavidus TaxID=569882 RepID=A0A1H8UMU9_9RHOB|nr:Acyl-CoA synthetase (NDP forming) [Salinihabitans flavidus]